MLCAALVALVSMSAYLHAFSGLDRALQSGVQAYALGPWPSLALHLAPLSFALAGLLWLPPPGAAALVGGLLLLQYALFILLERAGIGFAPAAGLAGTLLVLPCWSLLRLDAALRFLDRGTRQLDDALDGLAARRPRARAGGDCLDRRMRAAASAAGRMLALHRFVHDGFDHLADATLVLDARARVVLANQAAARHWGTSPQSLARRDGHDLLGDLRRRADGLPMVAPGVLRARQLVPILGEAEDAAGRVLLLRCVPFFDGGNEHAGWMAALVDITPMRRAQHQRDEALRFISHDLRGPSASILTALELARHQAGPTDVAALLARIERHARAGLGLADDFVHLARAEAQPFRAEVLDLVALLHETADAAWSSARERGVRVEIVVPQKEEEEEEEALCIGDRSLLVRALANVLDNALKFSPPGADVRCGLARRERHWAVWMHDRGPGIDPALQSRLFQPFERLHRDSHPEVTGVGLGLLLVRTAVQRHGGTIEIDSTAGAGCTVTLVLPRPGAADLEALEAHDDDKE